MTNVYELDDHGLVRLCQQQDDEAYHELVARYQRKAYWIAYNMLRNHEESRDIAQEAFIRVFKSIGRFNFDYKFYTWLYQIVTNLCIDAIRKRSRGAKVSLDELAPVSDDRRSPYQNLEAGEISEQVTEILQQLPPKYRTVIVLRDIQGIESTEIARIIDRTHSTVRWRLHKARQMFRELWESRYPESV